MMMQAAPDRPTVLVAIDGSPAAATAVPAACVIAAQLTARVEALHVLPIGESRAAFDVHRRAGGIPVRIVHGDPAEEILRAGAEPNVALIVLATHGKGVQQDGDIARIPRQVASQTRRPVLLVRPEAVTAENAGRPLRKLLFPVDGTPSTTRAFAPAAALAASLGAEVDVLFVVHPQQHVPEERGTMLPPYYLDRAYHDWLEWRSRVATWIRCHCEDLPRNAVIHAYLTTAKDRSDIGNAIAAFAAEHVEDAVVLVRRSHLERGRAPVLHAVFTCTQCPVLLVAGPPRSETAASWPSRSRVNPGELTQRGREEVA